MYLPATLITLRFSSDDAALCFCVKMIAAPDSADGLLLLLTVTGKVVFCLPAALVWVNKMQPGCRAVEAPPPSLLPQGRLMETSLTSFSIMSDQKVKKQHWAQSRSYIIIVWSTESLYRFMNYVCFHRFFWVYSETTCAYLKIKFHKEN